MFSLLFEMFVDVTFMAIFLFHPFLCLQQQKCPQDDSVDLMDHSHQSPLIISFKMVV